jgi:hypothetical protein
MNGVTSWAWGRRDLWRDWKSTGTGWIGDMGPGRYDPWRDRNSATIRISLRRTSSLHDPCRDRYSAMFRPSSLVVDHNPLGGSQRRPCRRGPSINQVIMIPGGIATSRSISPPSLVRLVVMSWRGPHPRYSPAPGSARAVVITLGGIATYTAVRRTDGRRRCRHESLEGWQHVRKCTVREIVDSPHDP